LAIEIQRVASAGDFARLHDLFVAYEDDLIPELRHGGVLAVDGLRRIYSGENAAFLAVGEERAAGCIAVMRFDPRTAAIRHLFVDPRARGAGAARALVTAAIEFARDSGCERVVLDTAKEHLPVAYRLYRSFGFQESAPYTAVKYPRPTFMELKLDRGTSMKVTANIKVDGSMLAFELDFDARRWSAPREFPEGYFPLTAEVDGKRYELYSDGSFAEVELDVKGE
jgi:GNAT superfamily N-acetyltransferase